MAGLKGITVNTAPEAEPHIYAEDDAAIFQSIFGEDGVSSIGQACKATVLSNNKVRIADGVVFVGGHFARIPYGEYVDCEIANGQSGKNRNDIIVAKFVTTGSGGIDTMTCEVKQGTAGTTAADPALTQNDIYKGGKIREFPLYRVKIEGLNITAVEQLFTVVPTNEELIKTVAELNGNTSITANGICKKYNNGIMEQYIKADRKTSAWSAWKYMYYATVSAVDYIEPFKEIMYLDVHLCTKDVALDAMPLNDGTLSKSPNMYTIRPDIANQTDVTVYIHVIGRWN